MNAAEQFCSNEHCPKRGQIGQDNIKLHSRIESRFHCTDVLNVRGLEKKVRSKESE